MDEESNGVEDTHAAEQQVADSDDGNSTSFINSSSSSSSSSEDEDDEEDEEPPRLKYTRFTNLPPSFFNKDAISTCHFHPSVIVFATHSGFVHLMKPDLTPIRTFRAHRASVLSIHTDGEYIATGSMDGTVVIGSIADANDIVGFDFKRPIHAVVIDGRYSVTKSFITGGTSGKVILSTKNWLGQRVDTLIDESEGITLNLQIFGDLVVWMNDSGVNFYQLSSKTKLYVINLPLGFPRLDLYWPKIELNKNNLLIGWANNIWSIKLIDSLTTTNDSRSIRSSRSSLEKRIHVEKHIQLQDTLIAGLSSFQNDYLVLNYSPPDSKLKQPPELKILSGITLEDLSLDEVEMKNYSSLGLNDYKLSKFGKDDKWALVGPNDVIIVEEFNLSDMLQWHLQRNQYMAAWKISAGLIPERQRYDEIGSKQLNILVNSNEWGQAIDFLLEIVDSIDDLEFLKTIWEFWIDKFQQLSKFDEVVDIIPSNLELNSTIYESFLTHYLAIKSPKLIELVRSWNHNLFDVANLNIKIAEILKDYDQGDKDEIPVELAHNLRLLHIDLLVELHEYQHAANHMFKLHDPKILKFLSDNHLLQDFFKKIPELVIIDLSPDELKYSSIRTLEDEIYDRVKILIENRHELLPIDIVELMKLNNLNVVNFFYLKQLFDTPGFISNVNFEDEMVNLYSEFDSGNLLLFLHKYKNYSIESAIDICKRYNLTKELVFLYSRIGQNKTALDLIINELDDPQYAIEFTLSLQDTELFEHLVEYSSDKPEFIKLLIIEAGKNRVDMRKIITRVPSGVEIENLPNTLIGIASNNLGENMIHSQVLKIIQDETMNLIFKMRSMRLSGDVFDPLYQEKILDGETIVKFFGDESKLYKESEVVTEGSDSWNQVPRTLSDKIRHFIHIKNRKSL